MQKLTLTAAAAALLGLAATGAQAVTTLTATNGGGVVTTKTNNIGSYTYVTGGGSGFSPRYDAFDFTPTATAGVTGVTSLTVNLFDEGYKYPSTPSDSKGGGLDLWIEPDTATNIAGGGPLTFDTTSATGVDVGTSNGFTTAPLLLGDVTVPTLASTPPNTPYTFTFTPSAGISSYLATQLKNGGDIRLLLTPDSKTDPIDLDIFGYAPGAGNNAPSLTLTTSSAGPGAAVPEASSYALLALGLLPLGLIARKRRAAK